MRQYTIQFDSPGAMFAESTFRDVPHEQWNTTHAVRLASEITERHNATPYAFRLQEYIAHDGPLVVDGVELDVEPKRVSESGNYYIGGELEYFHEIRDAGYDNNRILLRNMQGNRFPVVVITRNSYKSTQPFDERDFIVDRSGKIVRRGADADLVQYRADWIARWDAETQDAIRRHTSR